MAQGRPGPFNLNQELLLFTDSTSRGGKLGVSREAYLRNLKSRFRGITFTALMDALNLLEEQGLVKIEWAGPETFTVNLTEMSRALLHPEEKPATPPPAPEAPPTPAPAPPPQPIVVVVPTPVPLAPTPPAPKEPEAPPPSEESTPEPEASTFADMSDDSAKEATVSTDPEPSEQEEVAPEEEMSQTEMMQQEEAGQDAGAVDTRAEWEEWLNNRAQELSNREQTLASQEAELADKTASMDAREREFIDLNDRVDKRFKEVLGKTKETLAVEEARLEGKINALPAGDEALEQLLETIKEFKGKLDEILKERLKLRRSLQDASDALDKKSAQGGEEGGQAS